MLNIAFRSEQVLCQQVSLFIHSTHSLMSMLGQVLVYMDKMKFIIIIHHHHHHHHHTIIINHKGPRRRGLVQWKQHFQVWEKDKLGSQHALVITSLSSVKNELCVFSASISLLVTKHKEVIYDFNAVKPVENNLLQLIISFTNLSQMLWIILKV